MHLQGNLEVFLWANGIFIERFCEHSCILVFEKFNDAALPLIWWRKKVFWKVEICEVVLRVYDFLGEKSLRISFECGTIKKVWLSWDENSINLTHQQHMYQILHPFTPSKKPVKFQKKVHKLSKVNPLNILKQNKRKNSNSKLVTCQKLFLHLHQNSNRNKFKENSLALILSCETLFRIAEQIKYKEIDWRVANTRSKKKNSSFSVVENSTDGRKIRITGAKKNYFF